MFYNTIIDWTFSIIAVLVFIPLFVIKVAMLLIIKVAKAILFVRDEIHFSTKRIAVGLGERLSVKGWLGLKRVWELVRVCGLLLPTPLSQTLFLSLKSHSL